MKTFEENKQIVIEIVETKEFQDIFPDNDREIDCDSYTKDGDKEVALFVDWLKIGKYKEENVSKRLTIVFGNGFLDIYKRNQAKEKMQLVLRELKLTFEKFNANNNNLKKIRLDG